MNAKAEDVQADYFVDGMPNEEYHKPENGESSSTVKWFNPATYQWNKDAKKDEEKLKALDFGTDFHTYVLEPDVFDSQYRVLPPCNRKKPAEKQAELDMIKEWAEEGVTPITDEDMAKLKAMRESALAHPTIAAILGMKGVAERSYFWTDPETGVDCKCRPDWIVLDLDDDTRPPFMAKHKDYADATTLVFDLKSIAQFDKMQAQIENLKYYVQDAFYTRGIEQATKSKVCFVFGFVSTYLSLGRYPADVVMLKDTAKFDGDLEVTESLQGIADLRANQNANKFQTVIEMDRPSWATRDEDIL